MKIGFIGLGNMGAPMAANLSKAGHDISGFDIAPISISGVRKVDNLPNACTNMDVVITMLPNGKILNEVYNEIVPLGAKHSIFIDCSTVDVESAVEAAQLAKANDIQPLDAPVSGGVVGAEAGTLTFMAGGDEKAFKVVKPLFEIMGQKAVLCGKNGSGQTAKICNNMILGISMIGVCEAFALADELNLDRQKMFDVVSTSSGQCWSLNTYCPAPNVGPSSPSDNNYEPGFASDLMLKDLTLAQKAADSKDVFTPLGNQAQKLYLEFIAKGGSGLDFSSIIHFIKSGGQIESYFDLVKSTIKNKPPK